MEGITIYQFCPLEHPTHYSSTQISLGPLCWGHFLGSLKQWHQGLSWLLALPGCPHRWLVPAVSLAPAQPCLTRSSHYHAREVRTTSQAKIHSAQFSLDESSGLCPTPPMEAWGTFLGTYIPISSIPPEQQPPKGHSDQRMQLILTSKEHKIVMSTA
jgi:hypothetical protein